MNLTDITYTGVFSEGNELYSTVFSNAGYDNDDAVFQPSSPRQSELDNGDVGF